MQDELKKVNKIQTADAAKYDNKSDYLNNFYEKWWGEDPDSKVDQWDDIREKMDPHHQQLNKYIDILGERRKYIMFLKGKIDPDFIDDGRLGKRA